jgi:hypothetical protein
MKEIKESGSYTGPRKYLKQRDQPLEIPMDCVRRLCDAIDKTFDEKISFQEMQAYVEENRTQLPIDDEILHQMF